MVALNCIEIQEKTFTLFFCFANLVITYFNIKEVTVKNQLIFISIVLSCLFLINWSQESTLEGRNKPKVNLYGSLETHTGKNLNVENITLGHMYKQIPLFETPTKQDYDPNTGKLSYNPKDRTKRTITRIDLAEVAEIQVAENKQFFFMRKGGRKIFYVPITIISNNPQKTKNTYLIEERRMLRADQIIPNGKPIEMDIPPKAVKHLVIKGYKEPKKEKKN